MFSLFKTRYYLKDIVPNNYIDIHNHLLPGIDDGAKSEEETYELISGLEALNISSAIATPHTFQNQWNNSPESIQFAFDTLDESNSKKSFLIGYASEYMLDKFLMERVKKETLLCLKDNYILVELPLFNYPSGMYEMLFELKIKDYKIIIAHPERYTYFHNNIKKFKKLKEFGVYFQLNLLSLIGFYGKEIQKIAEVLLENDLYDFTGTDIHNKRHINELLNKSISFSDKGKIIKLLEENIFFNRT
jgi:tyrosine-protein phosphatase YwqE